EQDGAEHPRQAQDLQGRSAPAQRPATQGTETGLNGTRVLPTSLCLLPTFAMTTETSAAESSASAVPAPAAPTGPQKFVWGVGRRKSAVARVRVAAGSGKITLNKRELNDFLTGERDRKSIFGPLEVTSTG